MTESFADAIHDGAVWSAPRPLRYSHELRDGGSVIATARLSSWRWFRRVEGDLRGQAWCLEERPGPRALSYTIRFGPGKPIPAVEVYTFVTAESFRDQAGVLYQLPGGIMRGGDKVLDEDEREIITHKLSAYTLENTVRFGPGADPEHPTTGLVLLCQWLLRMFHRTMSSG